MSDPKGPNASGMGANDEIPPRAPTLADAIASLVNSGAKQARLLQRIAQNTGHVGGQRDPEQGVTYTQFLETRPPIFQKAEHPLQANEWLQTLEQKFRVILHCTEVQKAEFAGLQLQGPAGTWWTSYLAKQPIGREITWGDFKNAFRTQFIPEGVLRMMLEQFLRVQQGGRSVLEYTHEFDHLAQYAPEHVNTESKKRDCYLRGLNARMQEKLSTCTFADYSAVVSVAITAEEKMRILDETMKKEEFLKRKNIPPGTSEGASQRMKVIYRGPPRPTYWPSFQQRPPQPWIARSPMNTPRPMSAPASGFCNPTPTGSQLVCFNCGRPGYFARDCHFPKAGGNTNVKAQTSGQGVGQKFIRKKFVNTQTGRVHYMNVEEIPEGEPILAGTEAPEVEFLEISEEPSEFEEIVELIPCEAEQSGNTNIFTDPGKTKLILQNSMDILPPTIGVISGINECVSLFQQVRSAVSSVRSRWNATNMQSHQEDVELHSRSDSQEQALQEDEVLQLQSDLRDLRDTLPVVYGLIDLAEWRNHEQCVAKLLEKLKDAVYEAEDLIDEFAWYELKVSAEGNATSVQPYIDFFRSVTRGRFNKVTDIHKRLTNRSSDLKDMGLLRQVSPRFDKAVRPETSSFPTETKIFGREEEVKQMTLM
nr:uncharacterized protein LOC117853936 [Setaria viridis]